MKLIYRKINLNDFNEVATMLINPEILQAWEIEFTPSDVTKWIERQQVRYQDNDLGYMLAIDASSHKVVGQGGITKQEIDGKIVFEIGCIVKPEFWNQGYATQMVKDFLKTAKSKYNLLMVYALIKPNNFSSQRVYLKNKFKKAESIILKQYRQQFIIHDVYKKELN